MKLVTILDFCINIIRNLKQPQCRNKIQTYLITFLLIINSSIMAIQFPLDSGKDMSAENDKVFNEVVWGGSMRAITMMIPYYQACLSCSYLLENQPEDFYR